MAKVGVDMHSHLIAGIDDGSKTVKDSVSYVRKMKELGFSKLITTPHIMQDYFKNTPEIIREGLEKLMSALDKENIDIEIEAAAEYLIDDGFEKKMEAGDLMTFGDNYLLVELSYFSPPTNLKEILFNLQIAGYKIILAHPERYSYWFHTPQKYEDLKDRGVFFQVNTISLSGYYSGVVRKVAEKLIDQKMIDFVGSDMHNEAYFQALQKSMYEKYLGKLVASGSLLNATL